MSTLVSPWGVTAGHEYITGGCTTISYTATTVYTATAACYFKFWITGNSGLWCGINIIPVSETDFSFNAGSWGINWDLNRFPSYASKLVETGMCTTTTQYAVLRFSPADTFGVYSGASAALFYQVFAA